MGGRAWTTKEDRVMRKHYPHKTTAEVASMLDRSLQAVYVRAQQLGLHKTPEFKRSAQSGCAGHDNRGGKTRFPKGHQPWNKGMKGLDIGGKETRFKKGSRPKTWVPIGTEVLTKDGYIKRKIKDDAPPGMSRKNWEHVHVLVWQEANGPIPAGHCLRFINGNKKDCRLENLELISRQENARRNSIHRYPPEVKQAIRAVGKLKRKIREKENEEQHG